MIQRKRLSYPMDSSRNGGAKPKKIDVRRERILGGENNGKIIETTVEKTIT